MATVAITIPDQHLATIVDAFTSRHGYERLPEPRPTRAAFARTVLARWIKGEVAEHVGAIAAEAARAQQVQAIEAISIT